jgi:hypothetical protein
LRLRRRVKLVTGVVVALALLISGVAYLLLIEWSSTRAPPVAPQSVETEMLRSEEPTRTNYEPPLSGYGYDVRFYNASGGEVAGLGASISREPGAAVQYRLMVSLSHHIETWEIRLDGDPYVTHLEWLSLKFNFSRPIPVNLQDLWLLAPAERCPLNCSFSLESRFVDTEDLTHRVLVLNLTQLRNIETPPTSPVRWSSSSFQFLMTPAYPEPTPPYFEPFTLEISFALHRMLDGGKVIHEERGATRALEFQLPAGAASPASSIISEVAAPAPPSTFRSQLFMEYYLSHVRKSNDGRLVQTMLVSRHFLNVKMDIRDIHFFLSATVSSHLPLSHAPLLHPHSHSNDISRLKSCVKSCVNPMTTATTVSPGPPPSAIPFIGVPEILAAILLGFFLLTKLRRRRI